MVPHQWPVALVVIWHFYSCLACSSEDSARDLPSSRKVVLGQGQVPCEFWADWPTFIFQPVAPDVIWHIYSGHASWNRSHGRGTFPATSAQIKRQKFKSHHVTMLLRNERACDINISLSFIIFSRTHWKQSNLSSHYSACLLACGQLCQIYTAGGSLCCDFSGLYQMPFMLVYFLLAR